jgi:hypothetical protein
LLTTNTAENMINNSKDLSNKNKGKEEDCLLISSSRSNFVRYLRFKELISKMISIGTIKTPL